MSKATLIQEALYKIEKLPEDKIIEVSDYADFLLNKLANKIITEEVQQLTSSSTSLHFLNEDEVTYSKSDLKEVYK